MTTEEIERQAGKLKAVAHPTRIEILEILRAGEECVCRIYPAVPGSQPNTSKHLAVMKKAGIVDSRQEGQMTFYWVKDENIYKILEFAREMVRLERAGGFARTG